jgi:hypothetical protein
VQRGIDRVQESCLAEWLQQAFHPAIGKHAGAEVVISVGGYEDDRNLLSATREFALQIVACHARHGDIEDQTARLADDI